MTKMPKNQELELLQIFVEETRSNVDEIEKGILALEKNPKNMEIINDLLVQFHTIKGNAKFFELNEMNELCHTAESLLKDVSDKKISYSHAIAETLFESEDVLKKLLEILLEKLPKKEDGKPLNLDSEELVKPILRKLEGVSKTTGSSPQPSTIPKAKDKDLEKTVKAEEQNKQSSASAQRPAISAETSLTGKFLTFRLDNEYYAFGIGYVQDIISLQDITPVPQTANFVKGVINLRGKVVPVIDLRLLFGMIQAEYHKETCIIIVNGSKGLIGTIVDTVSEVIDIDENEVDKAPDFGETVNTDFILGMAKVNNEIKILLNIEKILSNGRMIVE